jgi:hypothetical protein
MIVSGNTILAETVKAADWPPFELSILTQNTHIDVVKLKVTAQIGVSA